ncbi:MAG: hypothetical protein AAGB22_00830 [Bacteroidota bacterium]
MAESAILFEEKQYLGYNKFSIMRRTVLALFCFLVYYFSNERPETGADGPGEFLFYMGMAILVLSVILLFVLHLHTKVINGSVVLDGIWTARKVKIDLGSIATAEVVPASKYWLNRPVYNLHLKGKIRFFTQGTEMVRLTDKDGLMYDIGTQKPNELYRVIGSQLASGRD